MVFYRINRDAIWAALCSNVQHHTHLLTTWTAWYDQVVGMAQDLVKGMARDIS